MFDDDNTIDEILDTYWDEIKKGDHVITTIQAKAKEAVLGLFGRDVPSPRQFRNALYEKLVAHNVTESTAETIAGEAELYANAFGAFQLRGVEFAMKDLGLELQAVTDDKAHQYGDYQIPDSYKRIDNAYIWFQAFNYSDSKNPKRNGWSAIRGYVYKTPDGKYIAPFRGELIDVVKDAKGEFREEA